jgi:hypothetical protein
MKKTIFIIGLLLGIAQAQSTTITGTIKDLTQANVTSGKVTFTLQPSRDTTISGIARFTPLQVVCLINGSGSVVALDGSSPCTVTSNTALQPPGTYYVVAIWPNNVKVSLFTFYAVNASYDISTIVPTPTTSPAQNFVDIFSNQTIGGAKIYSALGTFNAGAVASYFGSLSAPLAATGTVRLADTDLGACWRNHAGSADVCISKNASDQIVLPAIVPAYVTTGTANPAQSGLVRLADADLGTCWRNHANSGDLCISKNTSDQITVPQLALTGSTIFSRLKPESGTALTNGDGALGGNWGTSPTLGLVGFDSAFRVTVNSGTGSPAANPTMTLTFKDGSWVNAPVCVVSRNDLITPSAAYWAVDSTSTTTVRLTFVGTPSASLSYIANVICIGQ